MLTRTLRRTLLDPRYHLPPTFLLPWTAGLATLSTPIEAAPAPPPALSTTSISPTSTSQSIVTELQSPVAQLESLKLPPLNLSESVRQLLPALRAQRQVYITVHIHGKAYLVQQGDTLRLPFLMKDVEPGDVLRLNRALNLGSRDFTIKPGAAPPKLKSRNTGLMANDSIDNTTMEGAVNVHHEAPAPHFVPHIAKGKFAYLDERLYVCRALVMGVESEPLRIMEKTKRRQRHVKHVKSKHRYTILKIKELQVRSIEELDNEDVD